MKFRLTFVLLTAVTLFLSAFTFAGDVNPAFSQPVTVIAADPTPTAEPTAEPVVATDVPVVTDTPEPILLSFNGLITNASGTDLDPSGLVVELHQYDMNAGSELATIATDVNATGFYLFTNIATTVNDQMAYWVSVEYSGVSYTSDFATYDGVTTVYDLPVNVFDSTSDYSLLTVPQVQMYFLFDTEGVVQIFQMFQLVNNSTMTVVFPVENNTIPFIQTPEGAQDVQFSPSSDSSPFLSATDGVAMPPGADYVYGIVSVFTVPYDKRLTIDMPFTLPADAVDIYVQDGIKVKSKALTEVGPQAVSEINFVQYQATEVAGDSTMTITLSGSASTGDTSSTPVLDQKLIIGIGAAGLLLVGLGIFLFIRERKRSLDDEELLDEEEVIGEDALGDDPNAIMDAIIALDDQYKAGELSKEVYEERRAELKARLKE